MMLMTCPLCLKPKGISLAFEMFVRSHPPMPSCGLWPRGSVSAGWGNHYCTRMQRAQVLWIVPSRMGSDVWRSVVSMVLRLASTNAELEMARI